MPPATPVRDALALPPRRLAVSRAGWPHFPACCSASRPAKRSGRSPPAAINGAAGIRACRETCCAALARTAGNFRSTTLVDFVQCVGDIFNDDGVLRCSRGTPAPPGSYTASCEQIRVEGKDLLANCRSRRGNLIGARLSDWRQCTSQIANNDGMLQCQRASAVPAGSYRATCDEVVVDGADLRANCLDGPSRRVRSTLVDFAACSTRSLTRTVTCGAAKAGCRPMAATADRATWLGETATASPPSATMPTVVLGRRRSMPSAPAAPRSATATAG